MSWRADLWQQLLRLRDLIAHHTRVFLRRVFLGNWPGLLAFALLLVMLILGIGLLVRAGDHASAQAPSLSTLAQIATRTPTRRATVTATATRTATATPPSPTPTATHTPAATATQIADSPLMVVTRAVTQVVPLPADFARPQLVPVDVITATATLTVTPTPTANVLQLLVPTATPAPTLSINEALEQPVAPGGLAGIVATANAASPEQQPSGEKPVVTEAETGGESPAELPIEPADAPVAAATVASQPTPDGIVRTVHVPVLMYHYLSVPPANADMYRLDLSVAPDLFAAHLDALQQAGYTAISLYALLDHLTYGAPLPEKPVVLTFDDGYRDSYTNAFPLLRERGMTATFFIVTDFINDQRPEYLTWDMVRELYAEGMSIEGHGRNHVSLTNKDSDYLIWQALGTYESIEHEIGVRPRFVSYPAGEYSQLTIDIFRSAGYWAGFTTKQGATHSSDDLFQMRRIRVRASTSPEELLRLLALDW